MLIFIDDSGDPGFKINKGSSTHFVIAMIIFSDELEAEKTAVTIKELKRDLGFKPYMEFKFSDSKKSVRLAFLRAINSHNFDIRCLVVNKRMIKSDELKTDRNKFYSYFIKETLKQSGSVILNAKVKIDGSGDRVFRKSFLSYLKKELSTGQKNIMKNCKLVDSKGNVLIQLADMIAGSINRSNGNKSDAKEYKTIFKKHIKDEWNFR